MRTVSPSTVSPSIFEDVVYEIYYLTDNGRTLAPRNRKKTETILLSDPYEVTEEDENAIVEILCNKRAMAEMS